MEKPTSEGAVFTSSPFSATASEATSSCWAGRPGVLKRLHRLQRVYRRSDSSLDVVWARLGAGKTHALYHFSHLLRTGSDDCMSIPVFIEMPEDIRNFVDLYRRIIAGMPLDRVAHALVNSEAEMIPKELRQAGQVLLHGDPIERGIAQEWISAGRPHLVELRKVTGIGKRIEDDISATDMLCGIVHVLSGMGTRLVLMVDEFQRVGVLKPRAREAVLSCVRSSFSRCPAHLAMVFAVACQIESNALDLLPAELRTLLGNRPTVSLPEMTNEEAVDFVLERFRFFRPPEFCGEDSAPFMYSTIEKTIAYLDENGVSLIPRNILQALAWIYDEAELDGLETVDEAVAEEILSNMRLNN